MGQFRTGNGIVFEVTLKILSLCLKDFELDREKKIQNHT